jgi:hypothetical protein
MRTPRPDWKRRSRCRTPAPGSGRVLAGCRCAVLASPVRFALQERASCVLMASRRSGRPRRGTTPGRTAPDGVGRVSEVAAATASTRDCTTDATPLLRVGLPPGQFLGLPFGVGLLACRRRSYSASFGSASFSFAKLSFDRFSHFFASASQSTGCAALSPVGSVGSVVGSVGDGFGHAGSPSVRMGLVGRAAAAGRVTGNSGGRRRGHRYDRFGLRPSRNRSRSSSPTAPAAPRC